MFSPKDTVNHIRKLTQAVLTKDTAGKLTVQNFIKLHGKSLATYPSVTLIGYHLLESKLFFAKLLRLIPADPDYAAAINITTLVRS